MWVQRWTDTGLFWWSAVKNPLGLLTVMLTLPALPTETLPPRPKPSSTVPFRRDLDFVEREVLTEIRKKCSEPASRAALGLISVERKSQLAIEYSYLVREEHPQRWVFWVFAGNVARFEEGYRTIADRVKLPRRDEPTADVVRLVSNWLGDEANGQWIMILDNVDDPAVPLSSFLPQTQTGSILITSRNRDAAFRLLGSDRDIIEIEQMGESHALQLLRKKIGGEIDEADAVRLVQVLDCMPLAITQAAAYIKQRAPRITVSRYLDVFRKSDEDQESLLNRDAGDIRRDPSAKNSIITTWQISFEYIRQQTASAAQLLSWMSLFDRQGIPVDLLRRCCTDNSSGANSSEGGSTNNVDSRPVDDKN
ncbi:MAG: hypothetical protein Q9201_007291 [Fulgogasparrea decipioides]